MAYVSREIKDRVAIGDDCFYMEELADGRIMLTPAPESITESGTDINKALLQLIEDRVVWLMNRVFNDITANPFNLTFDTLDGLTVTGVWNTESSRIECYWDNSKGGKTKWHSFCLTSPLVLKSISVNIP